MDQMEDVDDNTPTFCTTVQARLLSAHTVLACTQINSLLYYDIENRVISVRVNLLNVVE